MRYQNILLLTVLILATLTAYIAHQFWKKRIDPRRSFKHFLLFMGVNVLSVFVVVFIFGFIIIQFKDFFFKK